MKILKNHDYTELSFSVSGVVFMNNIQVLGSRGHHVGSTIPITLRLWLQLVHFDGTMFFEKK